MKASNPIDNVAFGSLEDLGQMLQAGMALEDCVQDVGNEDLLEMRRAMFGDSDSDDNEKAKIQDKEGIPVPKDSDEDDNVKAKIQDNEDWKFEFTYSREEAEEHIGEKLDDKTWEAIKDELNRRVNKLCNGLYGEIADVLYDYEKKDDDEDHK